MTGRTRLVTISNIADTEIITSRPTRKVTIREDQLVTDWPTTPLIIRMPDVNADPAGISDGGSFVWQRDDEYPEGWPLGFVRTVAGSTDLAIIEDPL